MTPSSRNQPQAVPSPGVHPSPATFRNSGTTTTWSRFRSLAEIKERFGIGALLRHLAHRLINVVIAYDCYYIMVIDRDRYVPFASADADRIGLRIATRAELETLGADPEWMIDDVKLTAHDAGDVCLLSLLDGRPAGYTFVHAQGCPEFHPGLRISIPPDYTYNYAAWTNPAARGFGLTSYRDNAIMNQPQWRNRKGTMGYVRSTNFASLAAVAKSSARYAGRMHLFGRGPSVRVLVSRRLRKIGIRRL
jgi:hypothetical protein